MSEHAAILAAFDHARASDLPAVLATVAGTSGSTYRKPGARMMLVADGTRVGVVSGGCLEADVARRAWFLKRAGEAELVRYDTGVGDDATYEFGLGCRGVVEVLLERLDVRDDPPIIRALRRAVNERRGGAFATFVRGPRLGERAELGDGQDETLASENAMIETIEPPVQLLVFGSGIDVAPVVRIGQSLGWRTVVIDHRLRPTEGHAACRTIAATADRWAEQVILDERTAAVVMTHRMTDDAAYLRSLALSSVAYIGCLGPASRTEALFDQLALEGTVIDAATRAKVHAPVGLDLGAERPEEIALAIIAEIQATLAGGSCQRLRDRGGAIHADARAPVADAMR